MVRKGSPVQIRSRASMAAALVIREGQGAGSEYPLDGEVVLGRERGSADLVLDDPGVSRRHAAIRADGARITVTDLGSSNGTYANGRRITGAAVLADGDEIELGGTVISVHARSPAPPPPRAPRPPSAASAPSPPAANPPASAAASTTRAISPPSPRSSSAPSRSSSSSPAPARPSSSPSPARSPPSSSATWASGASTAAKRTATAPSPPSAASPGSSAPSSRFSRSPHGSPSWSSSTSPGTACARSSTRLRRARGRRDIVPRVLNGATIG